MILYCSARNLTTLSTGNLNLFEIRLALRYHPGSQIRMTSKKDSRIGRDARTGKFIPVSEAQKHPSTTVVETLKDEKVRKKGRS